MALIFTSTLSYDMRGRKRKAKKSSGPVYTKYKPPFEVYVVPPSRHTERVVYKSNESLGSGLTPRKESPKYTGTLIKGIATMHKSNAVPVLNEQDATDIARMRR